MSFIDLRNALDDFAGEAMEPDELYIIGCETDNYIFNVAVKMSASGESYHFIVLPPPEAFEDTSISFTGIINATDVECGGE